MRPCFRYLSLLWFDRTSASVPQVSVAADCSGVFLCGRAELPAGVPDQDQKQNLPEVGLYSTRSARGLYSEMGGRVYNPTQRWVGLYSDRLRMWIGRLVALVHYNGRTICSFRFGVSNVYVPGTLIVVLWAVFKKQILVSAARAARVYYSVRSLFPCALSYSSKICVPTPNPTP